MKRMLAILLVGGVVGCDLLSGLSFDLDSGTVTLRRVTLNLVNETDFPVDPRVYVSDLNDVIIDGITESLLTLDDNEQDFGMLAPQSMTSRSYECDDFKAVMAEDAELNSGIGISPEESTDILIDDEDFECGDEITIRFTGGLLDFDARIEVSSGGL